MYYILLHEFIFIYFTCGINFLKNYKINTLVRKDYIESFDINNLN